MFQGTSAPGALADLATSFWTSSRRTSRRCWRPSTSPCASRRCPSTWPSGWRCAHFQRNRPEDQGLLRRAAARGHPARADGDIQRQLGEGDGKAAEVAELTAAIAKANMPPEADAHAKKELRRYERMPEAAGEAGMVRTYLDWLIECPGRCPRKSRSTSRRREPSSTPTISAWRRSRAGSSNIWRSASSPRRARRRSCASSARPASARPRSAIHRPRDGPSLRPRQLGRRARRGRDPRPPAHLYRRAAGQHHPGIKKPARGTAS